MKNRKKISYRRKFSCDKSIAKGIKWLNREGFYTIGCCSGLKEEHPKSEKDRMYIEFENLNSDKKRQIQRLAREQGFTLRNYAKSFKMETEKTSKINMFNDFIVKMRGKEARLNLRAMGISNRVYDKSNKKLYSVQFYDFDIEDPTKITQSELNLILKIFPYDLILYKSKHGLHFISFSLTYGSRLTKARAIETSKRLINQDYWTTAKDLCLRVSGKWDKKGFSKKRLTVSKKPKFVRLLKEPNNYRISKKHLEFYYKFMGLPEEVYNKYQDCDKRDYQIKIYHYKTRD